MDPPLQPNPLQQLLEDFQAQQGFKGAVGMKDSDVSNKVGISDMSSMHPVPAVSQVEYAPRKLNSKDLNSLFNSPSLPHLLCFLDVLRPFVSSSCVTSFHLPRYHSLSLSFTLLHSPPSSLPSLSLSLPSPSLISTTHTTCSRDVSDVVHRLYEGQPFICKTDGKRFRSEQHLGDHLDRLFEINRAKKENLGARERHWFKVISEWVGCKDLALRKPVDLKVQVDGRPSQETAVPQESLVSADDGAFTGDPRCSACSEKLKREYDKEEDRWVFRGAVRVNGNGLVDSAGLFLVHQKCYQEGAHYSDAVVASTPRTQEALSSWGS
eukprot:766653-Hanusia_phi.AAC.11